MKQMLPCPFCGKQPVTERTGFSGRAMYIYCINDNGCPRPKAIGETEDKAIENWNTRATCTGSQEPCTFPDCALDMTRADFCRPECFSK